MNVKRKALAALIVTAAVFSSHASLERPVIAFYVSPDGSDVNSGTRASPLKTPHRAVELACAVKSDAKREIIFMDGYYELEKTIALPAGSHDFTLRAENRGKAVLSGAMRVTGWRTDALDSRFITADLPFKSPGKLRYYFMVNGRSASLSVYPQGVNIVCPAELGEGKNFTSLPYDPKSFPEGFDIASLDLESNWVVVPQEWASTRSYIATNDVANKRFILKTKTNMAIGKYNTGFKIYNSRLGMLDPGDWMFDQRESKIIYYPREGEKPDEIFSTISRLPAIFDLRSSHNCTIDGLVMEGCFNPTGSGAYSNGPMAAAVSVRHCPFFTVKNCEVRNSGGGGIYMLKPNRAVIDDNYIHDVSSTGINFIDGGEGHCKVRGNVLRNMHSGIYMQTPVIECIGNKVSEIGRSALTLWGRFSVVASNELRNAMLRSRDGGALYGAYDYSLVKDNLVKYDNYSSWPGLYADEGSQHTVFTGNRIEGLFWPMHMHQSYDIVISNNVYKYDGAMRWSFQGGWRNRFVDNKIYTKDPIVSDPYLPNCAEWARNEVYLRKKGKKDEYVFSKSLTLERKKAELRPDIIIPLNGALEHDPKGPQIDAKRSKGEYPINWRKSVWFNVGSDGYPEPGTQPGNTLSYSHDDKYVYFYIFLKNPMLTPYPGMKNTGNVWGVHDAIRLYFGKKMAVTLFWTGKSVVEGSTYVLPEGDFKVRDSGWWNGSTMELRLPIDVLEFESEARGRSTLFNAETYNADHDAYRYVFRTDGGNVRTGHLVIPTEPVKEIK